jgi:4-amino-4-deoxy-L-arabinose transferase-like glycosyltransferase
MNKSSRYELLVFALIIVTAIFFRFYHLQNTPPGLYPDEAMNGVNALVANDTGNYQIFYPENNGREGLFIGIQAISVKIFGNHPWALRGVSALIGVLTVIGLYMLTKELFDWHIAALASFAMAISFWHVSFSRIGFRAIMVPFVMVYAFHFLWRGIKNSHLSYFFWAGVFGGLGFYTYTSYRIAPLIAIVLFIAYWEFLKKNYDHSKYEHARNQFLRGFALFMLVTFFVALPLGLYFLQHPDQFMEQSGLSVFNQSNPLQSLSQSVVQTLGMFNFSGDWNNRHNIPGAPMLPWPIGIFFIIGFIKELGHWLERKHGHFSPLHTFLFAWFFIMLLPGFLSTQAPHAIRTMGVLPVVMIFTGRGIWWLFKAIGAWHDTVHPAEQYHIRHLSDPAAIIALILLLAGLGGYEYNRYFNVWAQDPETANAFAQNYVDIANQINALPDATPKYVTVKGGGILVDGLPVSAATVIFLTNTATPEMRAAKHITYLLPERAQSIKYPVGAKRFIIQ